MGSLRLGCFTHAGPTTALLGLGFIAWNCVPLYRIPDVDDPDAWAAARLQLLSVAYGGVDASDVLTATLDRTEHTITAMQAAAAAGDVGMQRFMETTGEPGPTRRALDFLHTRVPTIARKL